MVLSDRVIMMTGGPYAKVGDVLKIDIERPEKRRWYNSILTITTIERI